MSKKARIYFVSLDDQIIAEPFSREAAEAFVSASPSRAHLVAYELEIPTICGEPISAKFTGCLGRRLRPS